MAPFGEHLAHEGLDRRVRAAGVAGQNGRVAEVDDPQHLEGVHPDLQVRPGRAARRADRPRGEARAGPVGDEVVHRRSHDRHVDALQLGGVLGVGAAGEGQQARVVGLLAERRPAVEGSIIQRT